MIDPGFLSCCSETGKRRKTRHATVGSIIMHASREDQGRVAAVPLDPARPDAVVKIGIRASCNKKEKEKKSTTRPPYSPPLGLESSCTC
jgi:hypothetical protein